MFKSKNQFNIIYLCLITFIGLLFLFNNHQVIAMNNGHSNGYNNNHNTNFVTQARILQEMNLEQTRIVQQIFDARDNNASEEIINNLVRQNMQLSQRISAQQIILHNAMPRENNRNQTNRNNNRRR
ncbi:SVM family protein [Candidatus Phytoplasma meliae]|uniref:SVM family protein n=1 Tax=Candidatus Phytoplasma meliae TaxID=1848402 RepID=A0ABS5CZ70_9MOLU|nr:SVM family protein [Candidatus Phytoplasma meliae]MBP5836283.1 SVM family protein [Candidatus Phytoplasma meliae]